MGRFNARGRGDGVDDKRNLVAATAVLNLYPEKRNAAARAAAFLLRKYPLTATLF